MLTSTSTTPKVGVCAMETFEPLPAAVAAACVGPVFQESSQTPPTLRVKGASDVGKVAKAVAEVLKAGGEGSSVKVAGVGASAAAVMLSAVVTARNVLIHHSGLDVDIVTERFNLEHAHDAAEAGSKPVTHGLCVTVRAVPAVQQQADSGDA